MKVRLKDFLMPCDRGVTPETLLTRIARRMVRQHIRALPVCHNGRLVGVVTERNLFMRATAQGGDPRAKRVRDVMDPRVGYCYADQDPVAALKRLRGTHQQQLYVVRRDGLLLGLVRRRDLTQVRSRVRIPAPTRRPRIRNGA